MPFIFPAHIFRPKEPNARVVQQVISGGTALSGEEDVIATDGGGRWQIDLGGIDLTSIAQQRAWDAWHGYLGGGAVECLVPLLSLPTAPRPQAWNGPARPGKLIADDELFPTSVVYSSPRILAHVAADAALRATSLQIALASPGEIKGGEIFSIGDYAYRIVRKTSAGTFAIEPPLRLAVSAGDVVEFNWPVVLCRSAPGQDFSAAAKFGRYSSPSITFFESPPAA